MKTLQKAACDSVNEIDSSADISEAIICNFQ